MNRDIDSTCDLIELSDLFRRAAAFNDPKSAENLVLLTRQLGCALTYIYHEYDLDNSVNRQALREIRRVMADLYDAARHAGVKELVLPLHEADPNAAIIRDRVLDPAWSDVKFCFRDKDYAKDLEEAGFIRSDIKTFLDEGIRGLGAIDSALKYKWDADARKGGQLELTL